MKDTWICRDYQQGDENLIMDLYQQVNEKNLTLEHWLWKFMDNPFGSAVIKLMFDGDKLIGHNALIPMNLQVNKSVINAALSVNTMTHPDYRGQGIFAVLGDEAHRSCQQRDIKILYGFSNDNSYQIGINKLGWKGFGKMAILHKRLETYNEKPVAFDNIHPITEFDRKVDELWQRVRYSYPVILLRNANFLNWRFCRHPVDKYSKFLYLDNFRNISGYLVLKTYLGGEQPQGHIVDLLCINRKEVIIALLAYTYQYFKERGVNDLSCWATQGSFYEQILRNEGFITNEMETYFSIKIFKEKHKNLGIVEKKDIWHLTMCDSDVF